MIEFFVPGSPVPAGLGPRPRGGGSASGREDGIIPAAA
jgi:hypothetical protein